jgi:hypothetical protein
LGTAINTKFHEASIPKINSITEKFKKVLRDFEDKFKLVTRGQQMTKERNEKLKSKNFDKTKSKMLVRRELSVALENTMRVYLLLGLELES